MTPEIEARLAEFEERHKPDSSTQLLRFREEIVYLHFKGYSLKLTFEYLKEQGVGCSLRTFERWVHANVDFGAEAMPDAARRRESRPEGKGAAGKLGAARLVVQQPLLSDADTEGGFSLAGAPASAPELHPDLAPIREKPKHGVLVAQSGAPPLHSTKTGSSGQNSSERAARLAEARQRREAGFVDPVERALQRER